MLRSHSRSKQRQHACQAPSPVTTGYQRKYRHTLRTYYDVSMSTRIRKWRLAGELRGELTRLQAQELLRALAQPGSDWPFLSPSQRNAVQVLVAYNSREVLVQYFRGAPSTDLKEEPL